MIYILFHLFPHVFMDHVEIYLEQLEFPVLLPSLVPHQLPVIHIALWNGRCGRRYISNDQNEGQNHRSIHLEPIERATGVSSHAVFTFHRHPSRTQASGTASGMT